MKKLLFALTMLFGVSLAASAQVTEEQDTTGISRQSDQYRTDDQQQQDPMNQQDQDQGEEISVAQLPAAVTEKLQSQDYVGWTVESVKRKQKDGETIYAVELRQGNETKKVKFDAEGNEMDDKKNKDRDY